MIAATLHDASHVRLARLHVQRDPRGDAHEVGRADTGVFVEMPAVGLDLIGWLGEGLALGEVKRRFRARHGEDPDLPDFVATLAELGFVEAVDGDVVEHAEQPPLRAWQPLQRIDGARLAWTRSRPAVACWWLVAAVGWIGVPLWYALVPAAWPTPSSAWIGGSVSVFLNFAVLGVVGWTLVVLHELSHVFAMRALGQDSTLTLGHRLYFVVIQSDVAGARALPRRTRYVPYLSGMTWDLAVLLTCLVLHATLLPYAVVGAVIYMTTMGLIFQCAFFMRTDMYYVLTNRLRLGNLMEEMRTWLADLARRAVGRPPRGDLSTVPPREMRWVRGYAFFCAVSFVALSFVAFELYLPMLSKFVLSAADGLTAGPGHAEFWDAAAFLTVTLGYFVVLIAVSIRDLRRRRAASRSAGARLAAA
jgi:hypothetical protein